MNLGFWAKLKKPFFVLAPMADVTDAAFRELIAKYSRHGKSGGGPDVFWTEFVSADGLSSKGQKKLLPDLWYSKNEHPIVAQIFGANPENFYKTAKLIKKLGFDGIDINMGCPDRSVEKQGAGAALIKNIKLAKELIKAAQEGGRGLPVSVKTRVGYNKNQMDEWIPALLETGIAALTIHARTRKEMSLVPAHWEDVKTAVLLRDKMGVQTLIIGNGDAKNLADAREKAKASGADGVMLGRAIFGNPWLFNQDSLFQCSQEHWNRESAEVKERLSVMVEHTKLFEKKLGKVKNFAIMKKHYKAYAHGFDGAKELRVKLMDAENAKEVEGIVKKFLQV